MSRAKQHKDKPNDHKNCVTEDRLTTVLSAKSSVKKRNDYERGRKFERVPIFRGYILKEIK